MRTITIKIETDSEEPFVLIKDDIEEELSCCWNWNWFDKVEISEEIKGDSDAPTANVPDRKVGEWIWDDEMGVFLCSSCKNGWKDQPTLMGKPLFEWCPVCGAEMKKGEKE